MVMMGADGSLGGLDSGTDRACEGKSIMLTTNAQITGMSSANAPSLQSETLFSP